jgi:hypothetical protein
MLSGDKIVNAGFPIRSGITREETHPWNISVISSTDSVA